MVLQFFDQCEAQAKSNALLSVFSFMLPRYNSLIAFFSNKKKTGFFLSVRYDAITMYDHYHTGIFFGF